MANINRVKTQDGTLYDIEDSVARAGIIVDATVSGNPISVNAVATEADVSMTISPTQEGSGTPSPDNVRPISGITTATVQTTDGETTNEASMALGETVYAGSVDFNAGTGSKTMASVDLGTYTWVKVDNTGRFDSVTSASTIKKPAALTDVADILCSEYKPQSYSAKASGDISVHTNGNVVIVDSTKASLDATEFESEMSGVQLVYELATPEILSLTPDTLTMLEGAQTISGNGETVTVTFEQGVKQYVDSKIPDAPTTAGTYALTCTVTSGVPAYSWEATS